jgi:adenine-specific DNA-methyltransferase
MGNKYPFYLLADSKDGQIKEAEITRKAPSTNATFNDLRCGFVYDRVPHVTLKAIADNLELDEIWSKFSDDLEQSRIALNKSVGQNYEDWTIPRLPIDSWSEEAKKHHGFYWLNKLKLFEEAELSIGTRAEFVQLFDKPYEDKRKVRVAGPFTVESLSPHRALGVDEDDNLIDGLINTEDIPKQSFTQMILDNLKTSGVQQAHKEDKIEFSFLAPWPGDLVC